MGVHGSSWRRRGFPANVLWRRTIVVAAIFMTLAGLFAMHGMSPGQMLSGPDIHTVAMVMDTGTSSGTFDDSRQFAPSGQRQHPAMGHGECVAVLRVSSAPGPADVGPTSASATPVSSFLTTPAASDRAPPPPSLTRLCISRT